MGITRRKKHGLDVSFFTFSFFATDNPEPTASECGFPSFPQFVFSFVLSSLESQLLGIPLQVGSCPRTSSCGRSGSPANLQLTNPMPRSGRVNPVPTLDGHAVAADFVKNDLPKHHPLFQQLSSQLASHPQAQDLLAPEPVMMTGVAPAPQHAAPAAGPVGPAQAPGAQPPAGVPPATEPPAELKKKMEYWNKIFPEAMTEFMGKEGIALPRNMKKKPEYHIRNETSWNAVYDKLEAARERYKSKHGVSGTMRLVWRWTADNALSTLELVPKLMPDMDIATPVLGAFDVLVQAAKTASGVREKVLHAFDGLPDLYSDVEVFLGASGENEDIKEQAISLVANLLVAIERAISFFISWAVTRAVQATFTGEDYKKSLLDSFKTVMDDSKKLIGVAYRSHFQNFHTFSAETKSTLLRISEKQGVLDTSIESISTSIKELSDKLEKLATQNKEMIQLQKTTISLLSDKHDEEMRRAREENSRLQAELAVERQEKMHMGQIIRGMSPAVNQSPWAPPPPLPQLPYTDQDQLWQLLHMSDIDTFDIDRTSAKEKRLPAVDISRVKQIVHDRLFEKWLVTRDSARLLVHGNFSDLMLQTSALSGFCATLAKAFRPREHYVCLVWFCGRHLGSGDSECGSEFEADYNSDNMYPSDDEDDDRDNLSYRSGSEDGYGDFYSDETRLGPLKKMLRSLIAQLLCDHDFGPGNLLAGADTIDPDRIERGSLVHLRRLFCWLVRQLPADITLFVLLDGVGFYEREEFVDPFLDVLGDVLALAAPTDKSVAASVKVLLTSPWPTSVVRVGFEHEDGGAEDKEESLILTMEGLPGSQWVGGEERFLRELTGVEDDDRFEELDDDDDDEDDYYYSDG